ncbi:BREX-1 system adenine-specific DNA-methyltransferase PglX [Lachnospiraceae bacterium 46-15]
MDKNAIKKYAVWARNELIARVTQKAEQYEITEKKTTPADADSIGGRLLTDAEKKQRAALIEKIKADGFEQVMEEVAYTWFNRFTALRFMEVNNYLPSHTRVFTNEAGEFKPQILADAIQLELDGLDMDKVFELKDTNKTEELYKYLLIVQCNALSSILPRMFQKIEHYTELLLPDYLLREGSVIEQMISLIPEDNFDVNSDGGQIEIIGWLYQYYISEKHEEVVDPLHGKIVKKEEVPAATQLFTTEWVVRYLIDNSVGRYWIERNPDSSLAEELQYFVKPNDSAIKFINEKITPQDVSVFDPCVGSGHFLIYAFDVLMKIYIEYGYSERDAAEEIVKNNLFGLDIDGRASQLAYFSVMMKARQYDRRFFSRNIQPHIYEIIESNGADKISIEHFFENDVTLKKDIAALLDVLEDAKEYGSILQMPTVDFEKINERFNQLSNEISIYNSYLMGDFQKMLRASEIMAGKYAIVATNPPYLNKFAPKLKAYITEKYKDYSGDLFSVFIYRNFFYCKNNGYTGFMSPFVWMFIKTYEKLREYVLREKSITTLIQMEYSAYEEATVPICSYMLKNGKSEKDGCFFRLSDFKGGMSVQNDKYLEALSNKNCGYYFEENQEKFFEIPGSPFAFWISDNMRRAFSEGTLLSTVASPEQGMATADNNRFVRKWYEPLRDTVSIGEGTSRRWYPYNNGGGFRKWYGFNTDVVDWENNGSRIKSFPKAYVRNEKDYFKPGITWNAITSSDISVRYFGEGYIFSNAGMAVFTDQSKLKFILGFMNSKVAKYILKAISPTLNYNAGDISNLPLLLDDGLIKEVSEAVDACIEISKEDWDTFEISWDFTSNPLIGNYELVESAYNNYIKNANDLTERLKQLETRINKILIAGYGVEHDMNEAVEDKDVSLQLNSAYRYKIKKKRGASDTEDEEFVEPIEKRNKMFLRDTVCELISYAVGCMFGRYSLDDDGLVYAGGMWDSGRYITFKPDEDAIIPICDDEYFEDDIVGRFIYFIETAYGKTYLEDNLSFIANALDGKGTSREVIRNYFINEFYSDHLKMYQKRPIYWLFDSGKKNGFKCLVYAHRYQTDTVARIRTDYVHEQQSRYRTAIADLEQRVSGAASSERVKLNKQLASIQAQETELKAYEEKIHHLADQMIDIDMNDGIKANYEIFKDVVAKIK